MNDRAARNRRYLRLLLEGFPEAEAREIIKPKKRAPRLRKRLPLQTENR
jgi:hypothetical protein